MVVEEVKKQEFVQLSVQLLSKLGKSLIFDVYVKRSACKYTKLLKKGDQLDLNRLSQYVAKGIDIFYVTQDDYKVYVQFLDSLGKKYLANPKGINPKAMTVFIRELTQATLYEIHTSTNIASFQVQRAKVIVNTCIDNMEKHPDLLQKIIKSMSRYEYMYRHSIMCSMFSVMLAKADGIGNATTLSNLGLGAFLHDVGVSKLAFDPEEKTDLTAEERKEMYRHPELGKRMLDNVKGIRDEVLFIIMQHHEQPNGQGYPNGLRGENIFKLARIVAIADSFCALISERPYRSALTVEKALEAMFFDTGKFDKKLLKRFAQLLVGQSFLEAT